jgi:hypothetical protein
LSAECGVSFEWLSLIDYEMINEMLSPKARADFAEKMIVVAVVWFSMGRKVSNHFSSLERKFDDLQANVKEGLNEIATALRDVETKHESRISSLEGAVEELKKK